MILLDAGKSKGPHVVGRKMFKAMSKSAPSVFALSAGAVMMCASSLALAQSPHSVNPPRPEDKAEEKSKSPKTSKEPKKKSDPRAGKKRHDPGKGSSSKDKSNQHEGSGVTIHIESDSSAQSTESSTPTSTTTFTGNAFITFGGHLSIADKNLTELGRKIGVGGDLTIGLGPREFPIFFGLQMGFDSFGSEEESFTHEGVFSTYDLSRFGGFMHGFVRYAPRWGRFVPHIDLLGGAWHYNVSIQPSSSLGISIDDESTLGGATTGSYGFGGGLHYLTSNKFLIGLSFFHLRGGKMTVPNARDTAVVDDVLFYGETSVDRISQWTIMFEIGGMMH